MATVREITSSTTQISKRAQAQARLDAYRKAELAILSNQSYAIDGLQLTRANLADVQREIHKLENALATSGRRFRGMRVQGIIPVDL